MFTLAIVLVAGFGAFVIVGAAVIGLIVGVSRYRRDRETDPLVSRAAASARDHARTDPVGYAATRRRQSADALVAWQARRADADAG